MQIPAWRAFEYVTDKQDDLATQMLSVHKVLIDISYLNLKSKRDLVAMVC